jgi:hypothetical protein
LCWLKRFHEVGGHRAVLKVTSVKVAGGSHVGQVSSNGESTKLKSRPTGAPTNSSKPVSKPSDDIGVEILNGEPVYPGDLPWVCAIRYGVTSDNPFGYHHCTGSLIAPNLMVTAGM